MQTRILELERRLQHPDLEVALRIIGNRDLLLQAL